MRRCECPNDDPWAIPSRASPFIQRHSYLYRGRAEAIYGDGARSMFLKEARRGRTGAETPMLQSICEVIGTQVMYQLQASTGKESDGRDDGNDGKPNEHALTAVLLPTTTVVRCNLGRPG